MTIAFDLNDLQAFRAVPVRGDGASTRAYALETTIGYDATPGPLTPTGRNLDVAMQGNAWLAVQAVDGTEAYTRAGSMDVSAEGVLTLKNGLQVLGPGVDVVAIHTYPTGDGDPIARGASIKAAQDFLTAAGVPVLRVSPARPHDGRPRLPSADELAPDWGYASPKNAAAIASPIMSPNRTTGRSERAVRRRFMVRLVRLR